MCSSEQCAIYDFSRTRARAPLAPPVLDSAASSSRVSAVSEFTDRAMGLSVDLAAFHVARAQIFSDIRNWR